MVKSKKKVVEKDFFWNDQGSIILFTPLTEAAKRHVAEEVGVESWQWMGGGFGVDARLAYDLRSRLEEDGFTF